MPRSVLFVTIALCAASAALGVWAGWRKVNFTAEDAIAAAVADYVEFEARGGVKVEPTDCSGVSDGGSLVMVTCLPLSNPEARRTEYLVSPFRMQRYRGGQGGGAMSSERTRELMGAMR